jgi:TRAP-type C4-dicarboxylate transport system permease large subunit
MLRQVADSARSRGGSLGTIIPPSVAVVMGLMANVSVGDILYGMAIPGLRWPAWHRLHLHVALPPREAAHSPEPDEPTRPQLDRCATWCRRY